MAARRLSALDDDAAPAGRRGVALLVALVAATPPATPPWRSGHAWSATTPDARRMPAPGRDPRSRVVRLPRQPRRLPLWRVERAIDVLGAGCLCPGRTEAATRWNVAAFGRAFPAYGSRARVPAGLTGPAQVNGLRGDTSIEDRGRFDNLSIENWSLWRDVKIILRTVLEPRRRTGS